MYKGLKVCAVVLAAGQGRRMNSTVPKQFLDLAGKPVIYYSLKTFQESDTDEIVLVTGKEYIDFCRDEIVRKYSFDKVVKTVPGGRERFDSVYAGLKACDDCDLVMIHDGARAMVDSDIISRNIECAASCGACVTGVPSKDTVKIADEEGFAAQTPDRSKVWIIQTPQTFRYDVIMNAYEWRQQLGDDSVTDDAMVVEKYSGVKVKLIMGSYSNIKLTTPEDMIVMETLL